MKWAYGVTTVPRRRHDLLPRTLASLKAAGFDAPRLFVDGDDDAKGWRGQFGLEVTCRPAPALRVHGNWVLSLHELFVRAPEAERFAVFQDDIVSCLNLRRYLERVPYPDGPANKQQRPGYWNLYAAPSNQTIAPATAGFYPSNQCGKGALALVFSREAVITLLSSRHLVERPCDQGRGWRAVDGGIVDSMKKAGWIEYVHSPSLVLHTGKQSSSINSGKGSLVRDGGAAYVWPDYYNQTNFPGETYNALELLGGRERSA